MENKLPDGYNSWLEYYDFIYHKYPQYLNSKEIIQPYDENGIIKEKIFLMSEIKEKALDELMKNRIDARHLSKIINSARRDPSFDDTHVSSLKALSYNFLKIGI